MATNRMRPIHPGEILREEYLVPLAMSAHALAMALRVPAPRINEIVRETRAVTPDTALRLARFFDSTAEFRMNLQSVHDLRKSRLENETKPGSRAYSGLERQIAVLIHGSADDGRGVHALAKALRDTGCAPQACDQATERSA